MLAACSGAETTSSSAPSPPAASSPPAAAPVEPAPPAVDAGPLLSEAAARALLAERFRAAGHRVRYDVRVTVEGAFDVTLDGFDPDDRVGFEYIASGEVGTDVTAAERDALASGEGDLRILVLDASDAATVAAAAEAFLAAP